MRRPRSWFERPRWSVDHRLWSSERCCRPRGVVVVLPSGVHGSARSSPDGRRGGGSGGAGAGRRGRPVGSHTTGVSDAPPFGPFGPWSETLSGLAGDAAADQGEDGDAGQPRVVAEGEQRVGARRSMTGKRLLPPPRPAWSAGRVRRTVAGRPRGRALAQLLEATQQAEQFRGTARPGSRGGRGWRTTPCAARLREHRAR